MKTIAIFLLATTVLLWGCSETIEYVWDWIYINRAGNTFVKTDRDNLCADYIDWIVKQTDWSFKIYR